jgi:O-antigen/teichoic acid export membrane protein
MYPRSRPIVTLHSFTAQGLVSIGSQLVWGAQGLIIFVLAGRLLPQKEFGFVVMANAIISGGQCLLLGATSNPTLRLGAISHKALRITYSMFCIITVIVCAIFLLFTNQLNRLIYADPEFFILIKYLSIPFAATSFLAVSKLALFARMRYKTVLTMDIFFLASNITALLLLNANAMLYSAISFYMARSVAALIALLPAVPLHLWIRNPTYPQRDEYFNCKDYLRHSKYSSISMLSSYAQSQVDTLAVAHFLSPHSVATYGAAKLFYTGMTMVTSGLVLVAMPASSRIVASGKETLGAYYRRVLLLAYSLLLPGTAVLAFVAGPILQLCFHGRYGDATPIVRIFCIVALVMPIGSLTDAVANGAGWFRSACLAGVIGGVIGIVASLSLPRVFGILGAAFSPVLALVASSCTIAWLTWGRLGFPSNQLRRKPGSLEATAAGND